MAQPFALKYRPRTFDEITGQRTVRAVLKQMVKVDNLPPALVFTGDRGTGKTTTGRILAAALNCVGSDDPIGRPCGNCDLCTPIFAGICPDVLEIDAASNGLVDDIRKIKELTSYSASSCRWQAILLDEAHSMSTAAFNALLKILEEPPAQTMFILLTTEPGKIPETVMSRCMTFEFRRLSTEDLVKRLQFVSDSEGLEAESDLLAAIAERSDGGMRDAVMTLDQVSRVGIKTEAGLLKLLGEQDVAPQILLSLCDNSMGPGPSLAIVDGVMSRTGDAQSLSADLVKTLRDVLVLQGGGDLHYQGEALDVRKKLAKMPMRQIVDAIRVLWDLKTKTRASDDPRSNLDMAIVLVGEALQVKVVKTPEAAMEDRRLSFAEMSEAVQ